MGLLAEIADKMPSTLGIIVACLIAMGISVGVAATHRATAWAAFVLTLVVGIYCAVAGYQESFAEGSFSDAIWHELGWLWVSVNIVGPVLPFISVAGFLIFARRLGRDNHHYEADHVRAD